MDVKVIGIDTSRHNVSLSMRALQKDPLTETIESLEWRATKEVRARRGEAGAPVGNRLTRVHPGRGRCT